MSKSPINPENMRRLQVWAESVPDQAKRAIDERGPKIAAAMTRAMTAKGSDDPTTKP